MLVPAGADFVKLVMRTPLVLLLFLLRMLLLFVLLFPPLLTRVVRVLLLLPLLLLPLAPTRSLLLGVGSLLITLYLCLQRIDFPLFVRVVVEIPLPLFQLIFTFLEPSIDFLDIFLIGSYPCVQSVPTVQQLQNCRYQGCPILVGVGGQGAAAGLGAAAGFVPTRHRLLCLIYVWKGKGKM